MIKFNIVMDNFEDFMHNVYDMFYVSLKEMRAKKVLNDGKQRRNRKKIFGTCRNTVQ